jgi:hypothetical protein
MSDATRPVSLRRRAVLGGLLAGAGSALAGALAARAAETGEGTLTGLESLDIAARPIAHFDRSRPQMKRFGALEFRGGLVLSASSEHFGGWSGLLMEPTGKALLAVSDVGTDMTADVVYDGDRPAGLRNARIGPLLDSKGRPLEAKREQDAECVALLEGNLQRGTLLIGFERLHRLGRFPVRERKVGAPAGYLKLPADARGMRTNQGIEALAVLEAGPRKGSLVAFAERLTRGSGYHTGWIWPGADAREPQKLQLQDIDGFNITDATSLADGGLVVLERYFRWTEGVKMRLRLLEAREVAPGARLSGRLLFEGDSAYEIDNMEGIAAHRGPGGETVLSLISDDNFNRLLQRTVFLQFRLIDGGPRSAARG